MADLPLVPAIHSQASVNFGGWLCEKRKQCGLGLRRFANMIGDLPSNICNLENGRRPIPTDPNKLRKMAEVLGIRENTSDWEILFGLARRPNQPPADIISIAMMDPVPMLLRTVGEYQLSPDEIEGLIEYVRKNFGKGRPRDEHRQ